MCKVMCVKCEEEIDIAEGYYAHPINPMHWKCYLETKEGRFKEKLKKELAKNPYRDVEDSKPKKNIPKRYCWFHRNDFGEKIDAVAYWHTVDGYRYYACEECAERYGKARKVYWYGKRTGINKRLLIVPFDEDCDHDEYKKNMVTEEDEFGTYDIIACRKCGGQRKRRFGGR